MTREEIDRLRALAAKATPGPWLDITKDWNAALDAYRQRTRRHWHGPLRGSRNKHSMKHASALLVHGLHHGAPIRIDPATWNGEPDFWDLTRIFARTFDDMFHGHRTHYIYEDRIGESSPEAEANLALIAAMRTALDDLLVAAEDALRYREVVALAGSLASELYHRFRSRLPDEQAKDCERLSAMARAALAPKEEA